MRHFSFLLLHELRMQFISPATYIAATMFLLLMMAIYLLGLYDASQAVQSVLLTEKFYQTFWFSVFFVVPLITMKTLAEERRLGTLETLMTTPATAFQIVWSKFISSYVFYMLLWSLTLLFPVIVNLLVDASEINTYLMDRPSLLGSYIFIAISGSLYIAIGIFASSLTRSQLVAGMLSFGILFTLLVGGKLFDYLPFFSNAAIGPLEEPLEYIHTFKHLEDFSRGIIDTRPFFLYFSTTFLFLGVTSFVVESKV